MSKRLVVLVILIAAALALGLISRSALVGHVQDISVPLTATVTASPVLGTATHGVPVRLKIPKIHVDAIVETVGLTTAGAMGAPKGPSDVGWFALGTRPGNVGSAVIDGHFGWKNAIPAVFDNLHAIHIGDKIYVEDERGVTTAFVVRAIEKYGQAGNAPEVFSSSDGKAHLNLITCEGTWNKVQKSYSNRLIVFADKE